jgi:hypothetical protein
MGNGKVKAMQKQNVSARDLLADILLAHRGDTTMQYLYERMYGKPMPAAEQVTVSSGEVTASSGEGSVGKNIIPFPKRLSLGLRRKILRDAMQQLGEEN